MREIKGYCRPKQWRTYYKMGSGRFLGLAWHYIEIWFISFLLHLPLFYYPIDPHAPLLPPSFNFSPSHLLSSLIFSSIVLFSVIDRCLFLLFLLFFFFSHSYHFRFVLLLSRLLITLKLHDPSELNT